MVDDAFRLSLLKLISGIFLFLACTAALAQSPCLADEIMDRNFRRMPELAAKRQQYQEKMAGAKAQVQNRSVVTIPVVVHVVYKGAIENISDEQIQSQLDVLNEDYRLLNPNAATIPTIFDPLAADMEVEFCLAGLDTAGNPSTGITRQETPWSNIGQLIAPDGRPRIFYTELGGADAWDTEHYLNIWVCSIGGGILGYGAYPGSAPAAEDGIVIDARYFGTTGLAVFNPPHHLGRTATHEIGHYFNLLHIWGDDELSCADDDEVADTPTQRGPFLGCPAYPQFSCGNSAMFMNFMDYTNDACMSLFTQGQKVRLWATLDSVRAGLTDSMSCATTSVKLPGGQKQPLKLFPNPVSEKLTVECGENSAGIVLRVYDMAGTLWLKEKNIAGMENVQLDVSALPPGMYKVTVASAANVVFGVFVKI